MKPHRSENVLHKNNNDFRIGPKPQQIGIGFKARFNNSNLDLNDKKQVMMVLRDTKLDINNYNKQAQSQAVSNSDQHQQQSTQYQTILIQEDNAVQESYGLLQRKHDQVNQNQNYNHHHMNSLQDFVDKSSFDQKSMESIHIKPVMVKTSIASQQLNEFMKLRNIKDTTTQLLLERQVFTQGAKRRSNLFTKKNNLMNKSSNGGLVSSQPAVSPIVINKQTPERVDQPKLPELNNIGSCGVLSHQNTQSQQSRKYIQTYINQQHAKTPSVADKTPIPDKMHQNQRVISLYDNVRQNEKTRNHEKILMNIIDQSQHQSGLTTIRLLNRPNVSQLLDKSVIKVSKYNVEELRPEKTTQNRYYSKSKFQQASILPPTKLNSAGNISKMPSKKKRNIIATIKLPPEYKDNLQGLNLSRFNSARNHAPISRNQNGSLQLLEDFKLGNSIAQESIKDLLIEEWTKDKTNKNGLSGWDAD
ncbi:UNKNOWN [Stylonychia lemnae]|uniref:Uncharacterized protein n=1 Tax=Stylonychia lemnae TaxID=5949 RepID=A0A078A7V7_STYLE|nr:UNKNOWN [Stylonychia lemnae]|eukprot:CDW78345.1 UNKNOWN [Stylonychia lemnae]